MAGPKPTPYSVICDALRPGLASGILENRARRALDRLESEGFVVVNAEDVLRDRTRTIHIKVAREASKALSAAIPLTGPVKLGPDEVNRLVEAYGEVAAALAKAEEGGA